MKKKPDLAQTDHVLHVNWSIYILWVRRKTVMRGSDAWSPAGWVRRTHPGASWGVGFPYPIKHLKRPIKVK